MSRRISAARGASTLYVSSESKPSVRVDGELQTLEGEPVLTARDVEALLLTLVLIFAFQAENLTQRWLAVLLIAVPILIQVYFNSGLTYMLMRWFKVPHNVASPGALIGASNFFELAVAVAITLFGPGSGAALATVVGVLVEVPVMLSVCKVCNKSRLWYQRAVASET